MQSLFCMSMNLVLLMKFVVFNPVVQFHGMQSVKPFDSWEVITLDSRLACARIQDVQFLCSDV